MVLEPKAFIYHCHPNIKHLHLHHGDKLLVVDIRGGTINIIFQQWLGDIDTFKVKEQTHNTRGLCGGTYVDQHFITVLSEKVGCFNNYLQQFL
jgi:hypothetical protein